MAEAILFNLAREILSKLGSPLIQQFGLTWAVKKDLRMLENKISTLRNVLLDAQHRQITNLAVKDWLRRLKLVFYDADDLLDEVATEALTRQVETHKSMMKRELRTIVVPRKIEPDFAVSIEAEFSSFSRLRVLNCKCTDAKLDDDTEQPFYSTEHVHLKPIGNLKHLRYLSFRGSKVHPKSLCKLLNLQYLDLYGSGLHELPEDFGKLINLRFLSLSSRLTCLPEKGIGGLTSLRTLQLYDNPELTSLSEGIQHLTCLRQLFIRKCPKLASLPIGFKHLTSLEYLSIKWCDTLKFSEDNDLLGMTSIKELVLTDLPELVCLPLGLQHVASSLNSLKVENCPKLASLPTGFRHLTSLKNLSIKKCDTLKFLDNDLQGMRSLKKLVLSDLRELVSLPMGLQDAATSLHSLILRNCDKLKTLSESVLPNLKSLQVIEIEKCYSLFFLPQEMQPLTMLHSLKISECKVLIRRYFERDFFMIAHVPEIYIDGAKVKPSHYNISKQGKQLFLQGQSWGEVLKVKEEHDFLGFSNVDTKFWT
ncbi:Disease resistance protein TAO1 [Camellia lanceoleosa]|uniref:Disease resistance protein TAO1 n=1 Tax=Camellia lanceoleosa TaxID=1840588 RepID=A0ACC0FPL1_9ERIC|nr:Disease resistance protein TAO1 [Camellia lanceoleosa]